MPCDHAGVPSSSAVRIVIASDPLAVRAGLRHLLDSAPLHGLTAEILGTAEIVLAEALNNIVEHAYAATSGEITVHLRRQDGGLACRIEDRGLPMPDGQLPAGLLARPDTLAEGGFGWHLIRTLSQDLHYSRAEGRNILCFRLDTGQSPL